MLLCDKWQQESTIPFNISWRVNTYSLHSNCVDDLLFMVLIIVLLCCCGCCCSLYIRKKKVVANPTHACKDLRKRILTENRRSSRTIQSVAPQELLLIHCTTQNEATGCGRQDNRKPPTQSGRRRLFSNRWTKARFSNSGFNTNNNNFTCVWQL